MNARPNIQRPFTLAGCLIVAAAALALMACTAAVTHAAVYCVNKTDPSCSSPSFDNSLQGALTASENNPGPDQVLIGPVALSHAGEYTYFGANPGDTVAISGSGMTQTTLDGLNTTGTRFALKLDGVPGSSVNDLTITIPADLDGNGDTGLWLGAGSSAQNLRINGPAASNATGLRCSDCSVEDSILDLPVGSPENQGFNGYAGDSLITDSVIKGNYGVNQLDPGGTATILRSRIEAVYGALTDGSNLVIKDSLIEVAAVGGAKGVGLLNSNSGSHPMSADLDGVTIVGDGVTSNTDGIFAQADNGSESASIAVKNTVVSGTARSIQLKADNGRTVTAAVTFSAFDASKILQSPGTGTITAPASPTNVDLPGDPMFADAVAGDYTPMASSPLIDVGDPAVPGIGVTDILGNKRACNGTPGGTMRRDIGAFEYNDCIAPDTSINGGPGPVTEVRTPGFSLGSNDGLASWLCSIDGSTPAACPTLYTAPDLGLGSHQLSVTAVDVYGNIDQTPATADYTVVETVLPTCDTDPSLCPPVDITAPVVKLLGKTPKKTKKKAVKVRFRSNEAGSTFTCRVNKAKAKKCSSPYRAKLKKGRNVVSIIAKDKAGNLSKPKKVKILRR